MADTDAQNQIFLAKLHGVMVHWGFWRATVGCTLTAHSRYFQLIQLGSA